MDQQDGTNGKIYLGNEIGTLNDYSYRGGPDHERDSRWVHRLRAD